MLLFFFIIYFLIPAVITKIFNPTAELVIPVRIPAKEAKAEMEKLEIKLIVEIKIND